MVAALRSELGRAFLEQSRIVVAHPVTDQTCSYGHTARTMRHISVTQAGLRDGRGLSLRKHCIQCAAKSHLRRDYSGSSYFYDATKFLLLQPVRARVASPLAMCVLRFPASAALSHDAVSATVLRQADCYENFVQTRNECLLHCGSVSSNFVWAKGMRDGGRSRSKRRYELSHCMPL